MSRAHPLQDAVDLLNTLQTPYAALVKRRSEGFIVDKTANEQTRKLLTRIGYSVISPDLHFRLSLTLQQQADLSKLNIVHVAGTKGKGSTCAYVDSILSQYREARSIALKTGLFTSPHLIAVRERIRINSVPLSRELFAKYFFEVWDAMGDVEKPFYFRYLTLMSYHVFIREGVDVTISEVGLGGEYDATNIVERPMVTGISSLGIDHTYTLGNTIEEIAWHKAGIQKEGCPSFTVTQLPSAMKVVENRAKERRVEAFKVVGEDQRLKGVEIRPDASFQRLNASLAIVLAETVLGKLDPNFYQSRDILSKDFIEGLEKVVWRGRFEKKIEGNITWYLDGAHTAESIDVASKWFGEESSKKYVTLNDPTLFEVFDTAQDWKESTHIQPTRRSRVDVPSYKSAYSHQNSKNRQIRPRDILSCIQSHRYSVKERYSLFYFIPYPCSHVYQTS